MMVRFTSQPRMQEPLQQNITPEDSKRSKFCPKVTDLRLLLSTIAAEIRSKLLNNSLALPLTL